MLWTFLAHITSRFVEIRHFVPFMLNRLYEEQACSKADLLGWFGFFVARFDDIRVVINHFDVCPKASRDAFLQLVRRIAMESDKPLQIFITSEKPSSLQAEMLEWPSIDVGIDETPLERGEKVEPRDDTQEQKHDPVSQSPTVYPIRGTMKLLSKLPGGAEAVDDLVISILAEQQFKRSLTIQEILQEATYGPLETYTLEAVLDRVLRSIPNQKQARLAVAFLLFATRPLSKKECATAMFLGSFADDGESISPHRDLFDRLERQRSAWFAGITVNRHSGIRLAHRRLENILRKPESPDLPRYFWHEVANTAHYDIANACLEYLTRANVKKEQDLLSDEPFIVDSDLGFSSYAVKYWPHHFSLAQATTKEEAMGTLRQKMSNIDLERWSRTTWLLSNPFSRSRSPFKSPTPALISLGHSDVLEPSSPSDIALGAQEAARAGNANLVNDLLGAEVKDQLSQSVLLEIITAASSSGDESLIIDLIDRLSAEGRDELSKRGKTLLFRAARLGLARLVEKLLEMGTPVDPTIPYSKDTFTTPFCVAVVAGHTSTVKVLLNHGANANFRSHLQRTPLSLAASQGNADMIECLVKQGKADIEHLDTGSDPRGLTPLFIACEWGNPLVVKKLIDLGVDPSKPDDKEWAPIIVAATFGHWRTIQTLLDHGVDIETPGPRGNGTALRYVLANGHIEVSRRLLERGADPSSARFRVPLLFEVAGRGLPVPDESRVPLAKLLLEHNVDINATSERGRTGLSRACAQRQSKLAEFLLGFHPDVNLADRDGYTALYEATRTGNVPLVKMLLDRSADANAVTARGALPLHACSDAPELTRLLAARTENIDLPTPKGFTALMFAASKGWTASVKALLEHNANVDATVMREGQWTGWTALMFAAFSQSADTVQVLAEAGADLKRADAHGNGAAHLIYASRDLDERAGLASLNVLLEFRALDVDQPGEAGGTVLHRCAQLGHLRAVQRLIKAGANSDLSDNFGSTALGEAVWGRRREVVSYLLKRGADPNKAGRGVGHREGPLLRACRDCDYAIAKMLVEHGADVNCDSVSGFGTPLMAACLPYSGYGEDTDKLALYLLGLGVDVNARSHYVGSPLAAAALSARAGIVRALLDKGARCDIKDDLGRKAIHFAALNGEENFRLIEGVDPEVSEVDILGRSVLHYAAQGGRVRVTQRLVEGFPALDIDARDVDGWTALCWAARGSKSWVSEDRASEPTDAVGVIRFLVSRGADCSVECRIGDEIWTPIRIAEYAGAADEVIALLKPGPGPRDDAAGITGDLTERRRGKVIKGVTCDACLWVRNPRHLPHVQGLPRLRPMHEMLAPSRSRTCFRIKA
ncbi:ankyrin repeat-containing domain protein [Xylaria digitata]|nr:ankyrin repeat-containing domain protein [Xylaria digitata]